MRRHLAAAFSAARRRSAVGPPRAFSSAAVPPLLLVLDLDETLVRVRCEGVHRDGLPRSADFNVRVQLDSSSSVKEDYDCAVAMRPGLDGFLRWIEEERDRGRIEGPWIYTTSSPMYTKALLRRLDPGGRIFAMRVLTRDACCAASMPGFLMKDLHRVPPRDCNTVVRRKVLIDNNPVSHVLNPDSAVLVRDWLGDNPQDSELDRVRELLARTLDHRELQGGDAEADYVGCIRGTPGHGDFRRRLKALQARLSTAAPLEIPALRAELRAVVAECHDMKEQLLGAAP